MRQDFFTYQPQFKLLFAGNHQPTLTASTGDAAPVQHAALHLQAEEPDFALEEKLREEAPRILGWALKGCLDWQLHGLGRPRASAATDEYFEEQDLFGQWVEERCETGAGASPRGRSLGPAATSQNSAVCWCGGKKPAEIQFIMNRTERAIWRKMYLMGWTVRGKGSIAIPPAR
jgi:hypothetical protein